ncbi:unnamed protein product [Calypogeia fissa]
MGRTLAELPAEPSSTDALMLPQSPNVVVDPSADDLTAAAKEFLSTFTKPDLNSFRQNFRVYDEEHERSAGVQELYRINHINQTYVFGQEIRKRHLQFNKAVMGIWESCELLNEFVDESDPDLDEPQIEHLLQTAEAIRRAHPDQDWFHLTGLIHDLGKVLLHPKFGSEPQWAVVGDTYPLGCAFDESIVHHEFFADNVDSKDARFTSQNGIYEEGCGLEKVAMSWGHDEFLYQVLQHNKTTLPPQALFVIRYHSFYALHHSGAYTHLMNDFDREMLPWLHEFNKYDLYSKSKVRVDVEEVKPYYMALIEKYFPNELQW